MHRMTLRLALTPIAGYITGYTLEGYPMPNPAQKRALRNYRARLTERGMARFEVLGLDADRELIRSIASRLAEGGSDAHRIRTSIARTIAGEPGKKGGILEALRRSPLVTADIQIKRSTGGRRKVDL